MSFTLEELQETRFDVLIVGAGLAGVSSARMIKRRAPNARVLVIEKRTTLPETGCSEPLAGVSAMFFSMAMHCTERLVREHLPRHGEHFWFSLDAHADFEAMAEIGADEFASHPAHHVDTALLAFSLRRAAEREGVRFLMGSQVTSVRFEWPQATLHVKSDGEARTLHGRWVIDASGQAALVARELDLRRELESPGSYVACANWSGVLPFSDMAGMPAFPRSREFATHHFPCPGGSVTLVPHVGGGATMRLNMDRETHGKFRGLRSSLAAYSALLRQRPGLRVLLRNASIDTQSFEARYERDWTSKERCRRGWFLVGDAAGSPRTLLGEPLDNLARAVWNASTVVAMDLLGKTGEAEIAQHLQRCNLRETNHDHADSACLASTTRLLGSDAALCAVAYSLRRSVQSLERARIAKDLQGFSLLSWHMLWQGKLREKLYQRLRKLAVGRIRMGSKGLPRSPQQLQLGPGEGTLRPLTAAILQWAQVEYAGLREALSPVPGDTHEPASLDLARKLAALPQLDHELVASRTPEHDFQAAQSGGME